MAGGVEPCNRGAHGHGLAGADIAHDDAEGGLGDAEADAGDGLGVGGPGEQVSGGDTVGERGVGEIEVGDPRRPAHRRAPMCPPSSSPSSSNSGAWA